jgi:hypothetical protein
MRVKIADSFVVNENKIGTGNGEAKLNLGNTDDASKLLYGTPIDGVPIGDQSIVPAILTISTSCAIELATNIAPLYYDLDLNYKTRWDALDVSNTVESPIGEHVYLKRLQTLSDTLNTLGAKKFQFNSTIKRFKGGATAIYFERPLEQSAQEQYDLLLRTLPLSPKSKNRTCHRGQSIKSFS